MPTHGATTTLTAATHGYSLAGLVTIAVLVLVLITAGYFLRCWLDPFTTCHHRDSRRTWRCRRCQGTGTRLRAGRHLINQILDIRRHR